ncbi:MAG: BTAD domain-containing putative transcriptional regulator, partial [Litorilinea sp.]
MSEVLEIQLLGGFSVYLNGQSIRPLRSAKTRALLAYLAVEPDREHSRAKLATMLWGELPDATAKTNLRIELSNLKSVLSAHPALEIARNTACLHSAYATVDVLAFREAVTAFLNLPLESQAVELPRLSAALALYQGEFLAGFHLNDASNDATEFEDWQLFTREQLHEQMMLALSTFQLRYAEQGLWAELAEAARRQIAIVPWTESAHRSLMQALAAQGELATALAQYAKCREILQEELGVKPSLSTQELAARLRGDGVVAPAVQHNLAQQLKSFVGRSAETEQLATLVKTEKLVTLLGIGGVGKSHLAQTVAQKVLHSFSDGVWFVPLANIDAGEAATEQIALAIAAAIGFQVTDMQSPLAELATYLAPKQTLLVLDNWEHLGESAAPVLYALLNNSAVHILATSRIRLMVEGEILFPLDGLPPHEAYTLFVERARRIVPGFAQTKAGQDDLEIREDIARVCEQVAGLPLGIELATTWVEHYSV